MLDLSCCSPYKFPTLGQHKCFQCTHYYSRMHYPSGTYFPYKRYTGSPTSHRSGKSRCTSHMRRYYLESIPLCMQYTWQPPCYCLALCMWRSSPLPYIHSLPWHHDRVCTPHQGSPCLPHSGICTDYLYYKQCTLHHWLLCISHSTITHYHTITFYHTLYSIHYLSHAFPLHTNHQQRKPTRPPTTAMTATEMPAMAPVLSPLLLVLIDTHLPLSRLYPSTHSPHILSTTQLLQSPTEHVTHPLPPLLGFLPLSQAVHTATVIPAVVRAVGAVH
eukprot:XP_001703934.1 Hypothetical protein GL50803_137621 [Giardia lamblia ATCC 50803]